MRTIEGNTYFTTGEVARACSTSRANLLRLEEEGILIPKIRDGYSRFYSASDVTRLIHIIRLRSLGMTTKEIRDCLDFSGDFRTVLAKLRDQVTLLNKQIGMLEYIVGETGQDYVLEPCPEDSYYSVAVEIPFEPYAVKEVLDGHFQEALAQGYIIDSYNAPRFGMIDADAPFREGFGTEPTEVILNYPLKRNAAQKRETFHIPQKMVLETRWFDPADGYRGWFDGLVAEAERLGWQPDRRFSFTFVEKNYVTGAKDAGRILLQIALTVTKKGEDG